MIPALERRLGTRLWLLRLVHSAQDEEAKRIDAVFEVELLDSGWEAPGHGRWAGRDELAGLRLKRRSAATGPGPVPRRPRAGRRPTAAPALGAARLARRRAGVDRGRGGAAGPHRRRDRAGQALEHLGGAAGRDGRSRCSTSRCPARLPLLRRRGGGDRAAGGTVSGPRPDAAGDRARSRLAAAPAVRRAVRVARSARCPPGGAPPLRRPAAAKAPSWSTSCSPTGASTGGWTCWRPRSTRS